MHAELFRNKYVWQRIIQLEKNSIYTKFIAYGYRRLDYRCLSSSHKYMVYVRAVSTF